MNEPQAEHRGGVSRIPFACPPRPHGLVVHEVWTRRNSYAELSAEGDASRVLLTAHHATVRANADCTSGASVRLGPTRRDLWTGLADRWLVRLEPQPVGPQPDARGLSAQLASLHDSLPR